MREQAVAGTDSLHNIYRKQTSELVSYPDAAAKLPTLMSINSGLYRHRHKKMPPLPKNRQTLIIPDNLKTTQSGEEFLLFESTNMDMVVFCTPSSLRLMCESDLISLDGTFDVVPALYSQLFTLHVFHYGKLLPTAYCLLSSKERSTYCAVFRVLKEQSSRLGMCFNPKFILSDFESGIIAAVKEEFQSANHRGCFFHFIQVNFKYIWYILRFFFSKSFSISVNIFLD